MRGSIRLFSVFGISINVHFTFLLLFLLFMNGGIRWAFLVAGVFFFVTVHELCHSLAARMFGIKVREITLLPIGGVASMSKMPEKPYQEFIVSIAGPLSNIAVIVIGYFPMKALLGEEALFAPLSTASWPGTIAYIYWINLALAAFNLLPAFPMDGGRILRSLLAIKLDYRKATRIAAGLGHLFALAFAYFGIVKPNIMLILIAVFVYMAASSEELQTDVRETLKKIRIRDILSRDFITVTPDATLSKVLELAFHSHQEDFPVVYGEDLVGFVTRQDIMSSVHRSGTATTVKDIMRADFPKVRESDHLTKVQALMQQSSLTAIPVLRDGHAVGVVTLEDISRAYAFMSQRK